MLSISIARQKIPELPKLLADRSLPTKLCPQKSIDSLKSHPQGKS